MVFPGAFLRFEGEKSRGEEAQNTGGHPRKNEVAWTGENRDIQLKRYSAVSVRMDMTVRKNEGYITVTQTLRTKFM